MLYATRAKLNDAGMKPLAPGASVPIHRVQPGDDTHREIAAVKREAALVQREAKAATRPKPRQLSAAELDLASELFWRHDADAKPIQFQSSSAKKT